MFSGLGEASAVAVMPEGYLSPNASLATVLAASGLSASSFVGQHFPQQPYYQPCLCNHRYVASGPNIPGLAVRTLNAAPTWLPKG